MHWTAFYKSLVWVLAQREKIFRWIQARRDAALDKEVLCLAEQGFDNYHRGYLKSERELTHEWVVTAAAALDRETPDVWKSVDRLKASMKFSWQVRKSL